MKQEEMSLSSGEQLIYQAALMKKGCFHARRDVIFENSKCIIFFDGERMYPLGELQEKQQIDWPQYKSILGRRRNVHHLTQMSHRKHSNYEKHFAFLYDSELDPIEIPKNYSFDPTENIEAFCALKNNFIREESGKNIDVSLCEMQLKNNYLHFKPCLMKYREAEIGMVSSQIYSDEGAIINMLFLDKKFRGKGLGKLLLSFYIKQLQKQHSPLALFFSPQNVQAENLYKKLGFKVKEDWCLSFIQ